MNALITGATGYIGSRVARRLLAEGWRVTAVTRPTSSLSSLPTNDPSLRIRPFDASTSSLVTIVADAKPDVVFHIASMVIGKHSYEQVPTLVESNVSFPTQLLDAMARTGARRLINTGTYWQHYRGADYDPVSLYAATKQAFEAMVQYYVEAERFQAVTLELHDVYGPDDSRGKILTLLQKAAASGTPLAMSPGEQVVDMVHVDDVVAAYMRAAAILAGEGPEAAHGKYVVRTGKPRPLREIVSVFERVLGRSVPVTWGALPYRPREMMTPYTGGTTLPGWTPLYSLEDGLAASI